MRQANDVELGYNVTVISINRRIEEFYAGDVECALGIDKVCQA
jgi:hypothetical protein